MAVLQFNSIGKKVLVPVIILTVILLAVPGAMIGIQNYLTLKSALEAKGEFISHILSSGGVFTTGEH